MTEEESLKLETEFYELRMPGYILGKEVVDSKARRIGIVRSLRLSIPNFKAELIIKGLDVEFPVDIENVVAVGSVIQLRNVVKEAEEVEIHDILRLRKEVWDEIKNYFVRL